MLLLALAATFLQAPDAEAAAFDAAFALKKQQKPALAAAAFEEIVRKFPGSARLGEAIVESGVGWFGSGREQQVLNRATPGSTEAFGKARKIFEDFARERPQDASAGRAQYMVGSTDFFLGDLAGAEADYDAVLTKFPKDTKYLPKALERRAAMRRHLLETDTAKADLERYVKEYPGGEELATVKKYLEFGAMLEKPAPALRVQAWIQGKSANLSDLKGKVVGLYFFATWCEKCEKQRPFILDLERRYAPAGLALLGVVNDAHAQTVATVAPWLLRSEIKFPVMMDAAQATAGEHHVGTIPDFVLVDKSGRVRWHDNPANLWDYTIETLLAEDQAPATAPPKK